MPTFSVIIPAHNEEHCIGRCLRSVLTQDEMVSRYEVIVVNNASTDATAEIVNKEFPEVRLINEPRKGLPIAYNRGASEAKGDILMFVDADMILPRNHLKKMMNEFTNDSKLVAISGPYVYKDAGYLCEILVRCIYLLVAVPAEIVLNRLLKVSASIASGNLAVKKETFQKAKGFNEKLFYGMEADLASRIRRLGKVRFKYDLSAESSARRLKNEGAVTVAAKHILVTIAPRVFGEAFTKHTVDIR
jgi:glycosyltransferase involved in cell wall biosynthesis